MPQDRQELARRLSLAKPTDTVKGSLFRAVFAELERLFAPTDPKLEALRKQFGKRAWQEFSSFPVRDYLSLVYEGADLAEPKKGNAAAAMSHLGYSVCHAFLSSAIGKVASTVASGKPAVDVLSYAPGVYAVSASYGQRTFTRISNEQAMLKLRGDFLPPDYHLGVLRCGLEFFGYQPQFEVKTYGLLDGDYLLTHRKVA